MKSWTVCISLPSVTFEEIEAETQEEAKKEALDQFYADPTCIDLLETDPYAFDVWEE